MTPLLRFVAALSLLLAFHGPAAAQLTCLSDHQCADGDLCNGIEHCVAGFCVASTAPLVCDDGDPCTNDTCIAAAGCAHADVACPAACGPADDGLRCSDGTACTVGDTCSGAACIGTPLAWIIEAWSWRVGFVALAVIAAMAWVAIFAFVRDAIVAGKRIHTSIASTKSCRRPSQNPPLLRGNL